MRRFENTRDWAISSRAAEESAEGSTTRARSPERTVKPHEPPAPKGDDVVWAARKHAEARIKSRAITRPVIWDLFADETMCLTKFDKVDANATYHQWLTDALTSAADNTALEGDDFTAAALVAPVRVGAYQQISKKQFVVSGTLEAVSKAGRAKEMARQAVKQMRELKNDMEYTIVRNSASTAGGATTARSTAGMESWLATNEILTTTTSSATTAGFSAGEVTSATVGATHVAMTIGALNSALAGAWSAGGNPTWLLCNTSAKAQMDAFTGIAVRQVDVGRVQSASIINAASVIVTSFGTHQIYLHRHVRSTVLLCVDPEYWAVSFLRRPFVESLSKTGDNTKKHIVTEWGLVSRNEKASAKVVSIT